MFDLLRKLRAILTVKDTRKFLLLLVAIVLMGVFELAGIASIMPFMQLVSQPDSIASTPWLHQIYLGFGFNSDREFLIALSLAVLFLLTMANLLTVFTLWMQHKFAWDSAHSIAMRLLDKHLRQPFGYFLQNNSSQLSKQILSDTSALASGFLLSIAIMIAKTFVAIVIFALLILVDPILALTMFGIFGTIYAVMYSTVRRYLAKIGSIHYEANEQRYKAANEAFMSIKMVKLDGREQFFRDRFAIASEQFCKVEPKREATYVAPAYLVQTLAFGAIIVLILYLLATERSLQEAIPLLSLYALAGYRLLPALQQFYGALNKIRYQKPVVDAIYEDLVAEKDEQKSQLVEQSVLFEAAIEVNDLSFSYAEADAPALKNIDLTIRRNESVAFVGSTGSGKTTLVDLIAGLLRPSNGSIAVDGIVLDASNYRAWQSRIGYVPQEVMLYDDTIVRNIAFGVEDVDETRVIEVAKIANIHEFVECELPDGYQTVVGERGMRLSGGQRQRIGLARALYKQPAILILDEATSALDGITEANVMAEIASAMKGVTTIMIAHRLDTVKNCDAIYMMDRGRIVSRGNYESLIRKNNAFRQMARIEPRLDFRKTTS